MKRDEFSLLGALSLGIVPYAMAFGVAAAAAGFPPRTAISLSVVVYAGASQFTAIGVLSAGGSPLVALLMAWLVNLRFIPLGLAMPPGVGSTWPRRLVASHLVTDPSIAIVHAADPDRRVHMFWISGVWMYSLWIGGTVLGVLVGARIPNPGQLGLDAALPCAFIGILAGWQQHQPTRRATSGGAFVAIGALFAGGGAFAVPVSVLGTFFGLERSRGAQQPDGPPPD